MKPLKKDPIISRKYSDIKKEIAKKKEEIMKHQAIIDQLQEDINLLSELL